MSRWRSVLAELRAASDEAPHVVQTVQKVQKVQNCPHEVTFEPIEPFEPRTKCVPEPNSLWSEAEEERAAIAEYDGGAHRPWAEALARLDPAKPPGEVPPKRWLRFIDDCGRFLDSGWAQRAEALGWGPLDLFGCDRERPWARYDRQGLLWLVDGSKILELHRDRAVIERSTGAR